MDVPPALPEFGTLAPQNLVITNASVLRASAPQGSGTRRPVTWRVLGMCPTPAQGSADITSLYTARFGAPPAGKRVFIKAQIMQDGYFGPTGQFSARVPVSS